MIGLLVGGVFLMGLLVMAVLFAGLLFRAGVVVTPEATSLGQPGRSSHSRPGVDEGKAAP